MLCPPAGPPLLDRQKTPPGCLTFDRGEGEGAPVRAGRSDLGSRGGEVGGDRTPGRGCLARGRGEGRGELRCRAEVDGKGKDGAGERKERDSQDL